MECACNMVFLEMFVHIKLVPTMFNNPQLDNCTWAFYLLINKHKELSIKIFIPTSFYWWWNMKDCIIFISMDCFVISTHLLSVVISNLSMLDLFCVVAMREKEK
jgi:hypothetical protein